MKKLLLLGSSNGTCDIVRDAQKKGIYTIVTDNLDPSISPAKQISDEQWYISTADVDKLEAKCRAENVDGILCGISGFNITKSMELCRRLNKPFYCTPDAMHFEKDKADFKKICRSVGAPVADDYFLSDALTDDEVAKVVYPVVVKPVDKGANAGISFCYNIDDLREAFKLVRKVSTNPKIVVERMLHGEEWYSSYAVVNGEVRLLALNAMYHEEGYPTNCYTITTTVSNHVEQYIKEINPHIERVLKKIGCTNGYVWVQVMLDEDGHFYIIELGYRLDADKMYLPIKDILGYDTISSLVNLSCGLSNDDNPLPPPQTKAFKKCGCGHMLWTKKSGVITKIEGLDIIASRPGFVVDYFMPNFHEGCSCKAFRAIGTITYTADNIDEFCELIKFVNETVHVYDENGEDLIIKYTDFDYLKRVYYEGLKGK